MYSSNVEKIMNFKKTFKDVSQICLCATWPACYNKSIIILQMYESRAGTAFMCGIVMFIGVTSWFAWPYWAQNKILAILGTKQNTEERLSVKHKNNGSIVN